MSQAEPVPPRETPPALDVPPPLSAWTGRVSAWPLWAKIAALAALYVAAARVDIALLFFWEPGTPVWVSVAIALAALLLFGSRLWPGVAIGSFVADSLEILAHSPDTPPPRAAAMGLIIACGATLEVLLAAWLTRRLVKTLQPLETPTSFLRFIAFAAGLAPAVNAAFGAASLMSGGTVAGGNWGSLWLSWYLGDAAGIILITPLLLAWAHKPDLPFARSRRGLAELLLHAALLGLVMQLLFGGAFAEFSRSFTFLIVPFLAWIAFRFSVREVAAAIAALCAVMVLATVHGMGPFAQPDRWRTHLVLQSFICVTGGTSLFMASVICQHRRAVDGLRRYTGQLDLSRRQLLKQSEELRAARDEAGRASQMKSEFLATVSHEFRTPLNAVIGMTDLLLDTPLSQEQGEYVATVQASGRALLALVNDILDMSRIEAGKLTIEKVEFSLREVVSEVARVLAPAARKRGLDFTVNFPEGGPPHFVGDPFRIRQVLMNLGSNAVKFTERGNVAIDVAPGAAVDGKCRVRVRVRDTGIGIPADKQSLLFEKFIQADTSVTRRYGGSGLGLAISKRLVELMGGEIGLKSESGQGSEFWFELPLKVAAGLPGDTTASERAEERGRRVPAGLRVLVAEDNVVNQRVAAHLLAKLGCVVETAENGAAAVRMVRGGLYDLVFMDCQMPEMDGYTATAEIRRLGSKGRLPIIAMTASAMAGDRERCIAAGMDDYLTKPLDLGSLEDTLSRWAPQNASPAAESA